MRQAYCLAAARSWLPERSTTQYMISCHNEGYTVSRAVDQDRTRCTRGTHQRGNDGEQHDDRHGGTGRHGGALDALAGRRVGLVACAQQQLWSLKRVAGQQRGVLMPTKEIDEAKRTRLADGAQDALAVGTARAENKSEGKIRNGEPAGQGESHHL